MEPEADYSIIALGVHRSSGGPSKTIASFKEALKARLFCFCDAKRILQDPLAIEAAEVVPCSRIPGLQHFMVPARDADKSAEQAFKESLLVSCHSFYRYHVQWVNRMASTHETPYWFVPHGVLDPWVIERRSFGKRIFWKWGGERFLANASTVIFATTAEKEKAESQFSIANAEVIPWPVDAVDLSGRMQKRIEIRQSLGISPERKVLLYFGRLHTMKRPLETIDAVASSENEMLHLIMVGNEEDVRIKDCVKRAIDKGIAARVHVIGPVYGKKKFDYLFASDAYISLSWRENFNHTAAESLSVGLPVILSPGNDLQSDIESECCSWSMVDNTLRSAVDQVNSFVTASESSLSEMGDRGRRWVKENLSMDAFTSRLRAVAQLHQKS